MRQLLYDPAPTPEFVAQFGRRAITNLGGTVLDEGAFRVGMYDGFRFTGESKGGWGTDWHPEGGAVVEGRSIAVDRRIYVLLVLRGKFDDADTVEPFFNSFRILPAPEFALMRLWRNIQESFIRSLSLLVGLCLLALAIVPAFLFPADRQWIRDKLDELWIKADDHKRYASSRATIFIRESARLTARWFDRLLGVKLVSVRSVSIFAGYAVSSWVLELWWYGLPMRDVGVGLLALPLATALPFVRPKWAENSLLVLIWGTILWPSPLSPLTNLYAYLQSFAGVVFGIGFVAINRKVLRMVAVADRTWESLVVVALNLLFAIFLLGPVVGAIFLDTFPTSYGRQLRWVHALPQRLLEGAISASATCILDGLAASVIVVVMTAALFYRTLWPLLSRLTYFIPEFMKERAKLFALGLTLCILAIPGLGPALLTIKDFLIH